MSTETAGTATEAPAAAPGRRTPGPLQVLRWVALSVWVVLATHQVVTDGIPFDREGLLLWIAAGLAAASIGRRNALRIVLDFVPFAAVLIAYDYLRGASYQLGMPTWWHPQIDVDRLLFFGTVPTVWLQEQLRHPDPRWWDIVVALCYHSFFLLPYVTAGVLWWRSRRAFYQWTIRFVALSFVAFGIFCLTPAAPPWAAARCTAEQVESKPSEPACMYESIAREDGGILEPMDDPREGAPARITRISTRGLGEIHLSGAQQLVEKGQATANPVAAVPSLHLGGTMLFVLFMWNRVRKPWWPVLALYPVLMTFSLVYAGEHYVSDCLAGGAAALGVHAAANWWERRRAVPALEAGEEPAEPAAVSAPAPAH